MSITQGYAIAVHGGAGSPRAYDDGCARAAQCAVDELAISADALDAAIAAVASMEDIGERIVRHLLARTVSGWIGDGMPLEQALRRGVDLFGPKVPVGLIAVSGTEAAAHSSQDMPHARVVAP